jgi:hypothetical protein
MIKAIWIGIKKPNFFGIDVLIGTPDRLDLMLPLPDLM